MKKYEKPTMEVVELNVDSVSTAPKCNCDLNQSGVVCTTWSSGSGL